MHRQIKTRLIGLTLVSLSGIWITCLFSGSSEAQTPADPAESLPNEAEAIESTSTVLNVGIGGAPPFLIQEGDNLRGIVPDIWERIALIKQFEYKFVIQTNTEDALEAVSTGELDVLVGPFSITADRMEIVDFTQPFLVSNVSILLPQESPSVWSRVEPFFRVTALSSVGALIFLLFLVGNGIWLAEHRQNPEQFPRHYLRGVGNGMWFALVTLTTVGYGDRTPTTPAGRMISGIWMIVSVIAISSLTGGLASAFTLAFSDVPTGQIDNPQDLRGARMAVVSGSTGAKWAADYQARLLERPTLDEAIALVTEEDAEGVVFDRPALEYYLSQHPDSALSLAEFSLTSENLGFALPRNSSLTKDLSLILVSLEENGAITTITNRWLHGIDAE